MSLTHRALLIPCVINEQCQKEQSSDENERGGVRRDTDSLSELSLFPSGPGSLTLEGHTDRSSDLALLLVLLLDLLSRRLSLW